MDKYDIAVIGGGPGGYPAAIRAAQLGASVVLIEKESLGGTCLNWGCIPTKTLIAQSSLYAKVREGCLPGLRIEGASFDFKEMIGNKNRIVAKLTNGVKHLLNANGVMVIQGQAAFAGRNQLLVQSGNGEIRVEANYVIIATGCVSAIPAFLPRSDKILESRAFLDLDVLPKRLLVLGGGVIGCELGCMAAQLGTEVTIVELLEDILATLDGDVRNEVRRHMENKLKIKIMTGKPLENISSGSFGVKGHVNGQPIEADLLLCAAGRLPATGDLTLEKAGVTTNAKGFIPVDKFYRTQAANIFAIGDVNGNYQLAHAATVQGLKAVETALGHRRSGRTTVVPACIFTAPEIGVAGLTESEAKRNNHAIITGKFPFAGLGKAIAAGETTGFAKWIAEPVTGQLLGAAAVGAHATELIAEAAVAIQAELTHEELAQTIHAHPTLSEAWMEAAHAVSGHCIHAPPKRKAK